MTDQVNNSFFVEGFGTSIAAHNVKIHRPEKNKVNTYYFDDFGFILIGGKMVDRETSLHTEKREKR